MLKTKKKPINLGMTNLSKDRCENVSPRLWLSWFELEEGPGKDKHIH